MSIYFSSSHKSLYLHRKQHVSYFSSVTCLVTKILKFTISRFNEQIMGHYCFYSIPNLFLKVPSFKTRMLKYCRYRNITGTGRDVAILFSPLKQLKELSQLYHLRTLIKSHSNSPEPVHFHSGSTTLHQNEIRTRAI